MKLIINNLYIFLNFFLSKCSVILAYWGLTYFMYSSPTFSSSIFFILFILLLIRVVFWIEKIDFQQFSLLLYFDSNIRSSLNYFIIIGKTITFFFILFSVFKSFFFILFIFCSSDIYSFCMQPAGGPENGNPAPIVQVEPLVPERELVEARKENFNLLKSRLQDAMDRDSISQANRAHRAVETARVNVEAEARLQEQAEASRAETARLQEVVEANRAETARLQEVVEANRAETARVEGLLQRNNIIIEEKDISIRDLSTRLRAAFDANEDIVARANARVGDLVNESNNLIEAGNNQIGLLEEELETVKKQLGLVRSLNHDKIIENKALNESNASLSVSNTKLIAELDGYKKANVASTGELGSVIKENIAKKNLTVDDEDRENSSFQASDDDERSPSQVSGATLSGIALFTFVITCLVAFINGG
jgi:hypothetical protein